MRRRASTRTAWCGAAVALAGCVFVGTVPAASAAGTASVGAVSPLSNLVFGPGTWRGRAIGTGMISAAGGDAFAAEPFVIDFEFGVRADGTVEAGVWQWKGEIAVATAAGSGVFQMDGSGPLEGIGQRVVITGTIHMSGSMTVQGNVVEIAHDQPAAAAFSPAWAACTVVTGDLATEGRAAQEGAGVATSVQAPFTARMIAGPDADSTLEQVFLELVIEAETMLAAPPSAPAVVALVERVEAWHHLLFRAVDCGGAAPNLMPGTHPNTYLVELLGSILVAALADPSAYTTADVQALAIAAVRIGVVGAAAPDPTSAAEVAAVLRAVLEAKLAAAQADGDKVDCAIVFLTSTALGFTELAAGAKSCA